MAAAKHILVDDVLEIQAELEREFMTDFHENEYTFEHPKIVYNPYRNNPCAALIMFRTEEPTAVTIEVEGKRPEYSISHTYAPTTTHIHPILGLYDAYENTVNVTLYQGETKSFRITTSGHPASTEVISVTGDTKSLNGQLVVVMPALAGCPTGIDGNGDIRWYLSENLLFACKKLKNGHIMIGTNRKLRPPYNVTGLYEMDMVGRIYKEYRIPGLYHHDQIELENGDIMVLTQDFSSGADSVEDICVIIDRTSGEVIRSIDYKNFLPRDCAGSFHWSEEDWFHNNSLAYDKNNNSLTISGRHMDCIVNIDLDTEQINWIIGDPENWPEDYRKYFFTPVDQDDFGWQYEQHAVKIAPDGDILCFDNGTRRSKDPGKGLKNAENYSRGVRYRINTKDHTIRQIWQYGKERGPAFFSQYICNVECYGNDHYLVQSGGHQRDENGVNVEGFIPPEKMAVSDVSGTIVEVYGNEPVWEMRVKNNFYRASRMDLYSDGPNISMEGAAHLGYLFVSPEAKDQPFYKPDEEVPEEMLLHVIDEFDCFTLKCRIRDDAKAFIYLEKDGVVRAFPIETSFNPFAAISSLPYFQPDPDNKSMSFTKTTLHGIYHMYLSVEDHYYDTGMDITCI